MLFGSDLESYLCIVKPPIEVTMKIAGNTALEEISALPRHGKTWDTQFIV
jgi:hypothetical protein